MSLKIRNGRRGKMKAWRWEGTGRPGFRPQSGVSGPRGVPDFSPKITPVARALAGLLRHFASRGD